MLFFGPYPLAVLPSAFSLLLPSLGCCRHTKYKSPTVAVGEQQPLGPVWLKGW